MRPMPLTRRLALRTAGAAFLSPVPSFGAQADWTPAGPEAAFKICLNAGNREDAVLRNFKQIGVDSVVLTGPEIPWTPESLRALMNRFQPLGLSVANLMIVGFNDVIWGGKEAEAQIDRVVRSIEAAGKVGLPVVEYNFYAHRLTEGYKEESGRGGAGYTAYDYERSKNLPPKDGAGKHSRADQMKRAERFLKAVIPEAEKANVRLALHPNDPPVPLSRGSEQIVATFEHWKKYLSLVNSPYNGMTYDCGVSREMGEDPVAVCRYLGERDRINHVHYRNVVVRKPYVDYTEVFPDTGMVNMFAVMKELVRQKYSRGFYPEHPRALDIDRERGLQNASGGGGFVAEVYNVAYTKAMLQAALSA